MKPPMPWLTEYETPQTTPDCGEQIAEAEALSSGEIKLIMNADWMGPDIFIRKVLMT